MFTGLIQELGTVQKTEWHGQDLWVCLQAPKVSTKLKLGDSLAVNGCCLTVVEVAPPRISFQAVPETLGRTTLGTLQAGDQVNLETALSLSDPLGGHFVQGHVDGVAEVLEVKPEGEGVRLKVRLPRPLTPFVVEKGSIALDGVSLTVANIMDDQIEVALIPHTLQNTGLKSKKAGDTLQVEVDLLAKYVGKLTGGYLKTGAGS